MDKKNTKTNFRTMTNSTVAGIDLGDSTSLATVISPIGDVADSFPFSMDEKGYMLFQSRVPACARIAFEATTMSYPFSRKLRALGYSDITVAHPKELVWITKSKKKNDRVDSLKIAKLHQAGMIPESHLLGRDEQIARDLLIQRVNLGLEINRIKTKIISYLKREGVNESLPKTSDNFSLARKRAILLMKFGDDRDLVLKTMMDRLEFFDRQCVPLEARIMQIARESDDVKLLMTIPGVDFYLASLVSSYIGDASRFPSDDHLASYFGIIPVSRDSGNVKRRGRMSKDGPSTGRWALSIMVDTVKRYNDPIKAYYDSVKKRTSSGGLAHTATMRKLVRMIYHMLKTREHWKFEDNVLTEKKLQTLGGDS